MYFTIRSPCGCRRYPICVLILTQAILVIVFWKKILVIGNFEHCNFGIKRQPWNEAILNIVMEKKKYSPTGGLEPTTLRFQRCHTA